MSKYACMRSLFQFQNGQIVHVPSQKCLQASRANTRLSVDTCQTGNRFQQWQFQLYKVNMPNPDAPDLQPLLNL